jgi:putative hydrolase of the HAD superfamily
LSAITFDFGQTLVELDYELLARRVAERGVTLSVAKARADTPAAWQAYAEAKRRGQMQEQAWRTFMRTLLASTGTSAAPLAAWLWQEQPRHNLWRKPVRGMFELVAELDRAGHVLAIVTNSEGKASELAVELGLMPHLRLVADSGLLGVEKPDPAIFLWTAQKLGVLAHELIHVGDSWEADVLGALGVGARAVWFGSEADRPLPERVACAASAVELGRILAGWTAT